MKRSLTSLQMMGPFARLSSIGDLPAERTLGEGKSQNWNDDR